MKVVIREVSGGIDIYCPLNVEFREELKNSIPGSYREWKADVKAWWVSVGYANIARRLVHRYFADVEEDKASVEHSVVDCLAVVKRSWPDHARLGLLPGVPLPIVEAAYRRWAMLLHPDHGGNTAEMTAVNLAYERVRS